MSNQECARDCEPREDTQRTRLRLFRSLRCNRSSCSQAASEFRGEGSRSLSLMLLDPVGIPPVKYTLPGLRAAAASSRMNCSSVWAVTFRRIRRRLHHRRPAVQASVRGQFLLARLWRSMGCGCGRAKLPKDRSGAASAVTRRVGNCRGTALRGEWRFDAARRIVLAQACRTDLAPTRNRQAETTATGPAGRTSTWACGPCQTLGSSSSTAETDRST